MRRFAALILLVLALFAAGCWDLKEIEDLGLVAGVGVDAAPRGEVKLLVQILNPRVVGGGVRGAITPGTSISAK